MGYLVAGYVVAAATLGGYIASLFVRARRATARATAIADRRDGVGGSPGRDG
jgi:hypothetical protein